MDPDRYFELKSENRELSDSLEAALDRKVELETELAERDSMIRDLERHIRWLRAWSYQDD